MAEQFNGLSSRSSKKEIWEATKDLLKNDGTTLTGKRIPKNKKEQGEFWQQNNFDSKVTKPK